MTRVTRVVATGAAATVGGVLALIGAVSVPGMLFIAFVVALLAGAGGYALTMAAEPGGPDHRFSEAVAHYAVGGGAGVSVVTGAATVIAGRVAPSAARRDRTSGSGRFPPLGRPPRMDVGRFRPVPPAVTTLT